MNPNHPHPMPPVPRDHDDVTFSEMVPFRSRNISLLKSPLTLFMVLTALITPALFGIGNMILTNPDLNARMGGFIILTVFSVFLLLLVMMIGIYFYARPGRSIFTYLVAFAVVQIILATPLGIPYFILFRKILPGDVGPQQASFIGEFVAMFFGAGLCEELMKATPTLLAAWLGIAAARNPQRTTALSRFLMVRGPLDGVVMGVFAGAGFILIETALEYVPNHAIAIYKQSNNIGLGFAGGLMLLLPRVLGGMVGHMAYSGIFGYFIGLGVIRPRKFVQLAAIGWLASSLIHALWNSVMILNPLLNYAVALVAAIFATAALLKARHIQQRLFGDAADSQGSVVIDRRPAMAGAPYVPPMPPSYAPPYPQPQPQPHPQPIATIRPPAPAPVAEGPLALDVGGLLMPLHANSQLAFADEPALDGLGTGVAGAVVPHPSRPGVLGLRNAGAAGWTVTLRDGNVQRIERDQNIRLAPGVRIDFGDGLVGRVVARG